MQITFFFIGTSLYNLAGVPIDVSYTKYISDTERVVHIFTVVHGAKSEVDLEPGMREEVEKERGKLQRNCEGNLLKLNRYISSKRVNSGWHSHISCFLHHHTARNHHFYQYAISTNILLSLFLRSPFPSFSFPFVLVSLRSPFCS